MKKALLFSVCLILFTITGAFSEDEASRGVVFVKLDACSDNIPAGARSAAGDFILKQARDEFGDRVRVTVIEPAELKKSGPGGAEIIKSRNSRWMIYGTLCRAEEKYTARISLYDARSREDIGSVDVRFDESMKPLNRHMLSGIFHEIAEQNGYFVDTDSLDRSAPANRRLVVIEPDAAYDIDDGAVVSRAVISEMIKKDIGGFIQVLDDGRYRHILSKSMRSHSSYDRLAKLCGLLNTTWLITGSVYRDQGKVILALSLFNNDKRSFESFFQMIIEPGKDPAAALRKELAGMYLTISSRDDFRLHAGGTTRYITDFTHFSNRAIPMGIVPGGAAVDRGGNIIAACGYDCAKLDPFGAIIFNIGEQGTGKGRYQMASKACVDGSNNIHILDSIGSKVITFSPDGSFLRETVIQESYPQSFAVSGAGKILIADPQLQYAALYDSSGNLVVKIPGAGSRLVGVSSDSGALSALWLNEQSGFYEMKYYDDGGRPTRTRVIELKMAPLYLYGYSEDRSGNIFCNDYTNKAILKINRDNRVAWVLKNYGKNLSIDGPMGICASDDGGRVYVVETVKKRILKFRELDGIDGTGGEKSLLARAEADRGRDRDRSLHYLNLALEANPDSLPALFKLAEFNRDGKNFGKAMDLYDRILSRDRNNAEAAAGIKQARIADFLQRGDEAARVFSHDLKEVGPESAKRSYEEAVKNYELALKEEPGNTAVKEKFARLKETYDKATGRFELPSVETSRISFTEVFAALYKYYSNNPIGEIIVRNTTGKEIEKISAEITVQGYMDYPTESRVYRGVRAGDELTIKLFAVFNNKILGITEDTPMNAQIKIKYLVQGKDYELAKNASFNLYNRNAMTWDRPDKLSSFITPKDSVVKIFARETIQRFRHARFRFMSDELQSAIQIFDTLSVYGMTYVPDPKTPFKKLSALKDSVDFIQYPRDAIRYKTGDCDDLTVLYCSLLENIGIETALVTVPGHIFMMFNTGLPEAKGSDITDNASLLVKRGGTVWIPVETTALGGSFLKSWETAADQYNKSSAAGKAEIFETKKAWSDYAPVTLEDLAWEPVLPGKEAVEKLFYDDINTLIDRELTKKVGTLQKEIERGSDNPATHNKIGVTYAKYGRYDQAVKSFKKSLTLKDDFFSAYNNLGNVYLLQNNHEEALKYFDRARKIMPENAYIHINMAIIFRSQKNYTKLKEEYNIAIKIDRKLEDQYRYLVTERNEKADSADGRANVLWTD